MQGYTVVGDGGSCGIMSVWCYGQF